MPDNAGYDAIVLGLGGIGSGALYWLARSGANVLGIEQFELFHSNGGSQDHSRIIRLSYHTPAYVELAKQAYTAWADVETDLNLANCLEKASTSAAVRQVLTEEEAAYLDLLAYLAAPTKGIKGGVPGNAVSPLWGMGNNLRRVAASGFEFLARQQNLWASSGSGSAPSA